MKFRKKPVIIEAMQLQNSVKSVLEIYRFINGQDSVILKSRIDDEKFYDYASTILREGFPIKTLEGTMIAVVGDWIIKGVKGEFYPCKPNIFEQTYEKV